MKNNKKRLRLLLLLLPAALIVLLLVFTSFYYRADEGARIALESDSTVSVVETKYGWFMDGPSESDALIFYPGALVEEASYAPLLRLIAGKGMDVCLIKMPFHLALFGVNKADDIIKEYSYENWYIGGHSLGGAMAANYAADRGEKVAGLVLLAAYPTKKLDNHLIELSIYGSEDGVLSMDKLETGRTYAPERFYEYVIKGGNHAQFGNYGVQKGDGIASISAEEQQALTADFIIQTLLT